MIIPRNKYLQELRIDVGQVEVRITNDDGKKIRKLLEVDFICNSGDKCVYIQSALDMPTQEKIIRKQTPFVISKMDSLK